MQKETGQASIIIELEDSNITVLHGTDKVVLFKAENVPLGSWDKIWDTLKALKQN
jgi:hypothetical protein